MDFVPGVLRLRPGRRSPPPPQDITAGNARGCRMGSAGDGRFSGATHPPTNTCGRCRRSGRNGLGQEPCRSETCPPGHGAHVLDGAVSFAVEAVPVIGQEGAVTRDRGGVRRLPSARRTSDPA
jgi:hypothetical protein